jgi:2-iminobutanoate/2-iminopropanoate deaminase
MRIGLAPLSAALAALCGPPSAAGAQGSSPFPFSEAVAVGNILYLSGQIGIPPGKARIIEGGTVAETRQTMENIGATLRRNGLDYGDLVKCTVMMTDMREWGKLNQVYASFFPDGRFPARSAIGATSLALGASVEIDCLARFPDAPRGINPGTPLGPYSQAVSAGGLVFISGVIAYDDEGKRFAGPEIETQMRQVLANLDKVLKSAGISRDQVVKTTMFLRDAKDMQAANAAYAAYFGKDPRPARTTVPGADWGRPEIIVEIEAVAVAASPTPGAVR